MAFLLGSANSARGGYEISNSLKWNTGDSASLQQTYTNTGTGAARTLTVSAWVKKCAGDGYLFSAQADGNNRTTMNLFSTVSGGGVAFENKISGTSSYTSSVATFRDPSAWYHVVYAVDTTQGTASNRVKIYINGSQLTNLQTGGSNNYPAENVITNFFHNSNATFIGGRSGGNYYNGYMAEVNIVDGLQLSPSNFGETDDNGVWIPKTPDVSEYGTNGGFYEFKQTGTGADANGMGADTSGKDNHFTVANLTAIDVTEDTPTNNFATLMLTKDITLTEGNLIMSHDREYWDGAHATIGLTSGKWYWEHRIDDADGDDRRIVGGIVSNPETYPHIYDGKGTNADLASDDNYGTIKAVSPSYMYTSWATNLIFDGTSTYNNNFVDIDDDDVLSFALDLDNNKFFIAVNGSYIAGDDGGTDGDPAAGTNETFDIVAASTNRVYFPAAVVGWGTNTSSTTASFNFGNSSFAISSGNADTNGIGNFEYAVPDGFYSICTKNLAKYGG